MQLIEITSTPIKYEMEITPAKLEYSSEKIPKMNAQVTSPDMKINMNNISVKLDTYEARRSLGFEKVSDRIKSAAQKAMQSVSDVTREYVEMGKQMGSIQNKVTIPQIIRQKNVDNSQLITAFLPSSGADLYWQPNNIDIDYTPGKTNIDWNINPTELVFTPGSVHVKIVQRPTVEIEYTGGPVYIPKSADPNYEEEI